MTRELARRECEALVAELDIPEPFDLDELCQRIGAQRHRPIVLMPTAMAFGNLCGLWMATAQADYVFYEENTSRLHQKHIVCHEVGHILREHSSSGTLGSDIARALTAAVQPGDVQRVLGRDTYNDDQEFEAELIATLIMRRVSRTQAAHVPTAVNPSAAKAVARIARSLSRGDEA
ncbi:MAG TPA: hypothetical protein VL551_04210 [Actinospica sp.]|nr:hypothetical protein [Actinospica sp.]